MNKRHIAAVIAVLFAVTGCTIAVTKVEEDIEETEEVEEMIVSQEEVEDETVKEGTKETITVNNPSSSTSKPKETVSSVPAQPQANTQQSTATSSPDSKPVQEQPVVTEPEPVSEPEPSPAPAPQPEPAKACPLGVYPDLPCDTPIGDQGYSVKFNSEQEANDYGYHMLNDVMYIGDYEITNFAVQPIYTNDHSRIVYYGVELYSNGIFIQ